MKRLASVLFVVMLALPLAACDGDGQDLGLKNRSGVKHGRIGDTLSTAWFDFTVTDVYSCDRYCGYTPSAGCKLVVAAISLTNNCGQPVDMWGEAFVILWRDDSGTFSLDIPVPAGLDDNQFPDEYILGAGESKSGVMVFETPWEFQDFSIMYTEFFESDTDPDGEKGDTFFVDFTAEDRE